MTEYLVYVETVGDGMNAAPATAHVPGLPGAAVRGQTVEVAKAQIREAIDNYLAVLREAGEAVPENIAAIHLEFEESEETTFPSDFTTLGTHEIDTLLRWLAVSRQELVDLVKDLPETALAWQPAAEAPTVNDILYQIAEADLWYTDRLKQWPEAALYRLAAARGVALERLRALDDPKWNAITLHDGQKWTPRKVIRRMLEFERESIEQIRAVLAEQAASSADTP